jgi:hypothetical protein
VTGVCGEEVAPGLPALTTGIFVTPRTAAAGATIDVEFGVNGNTAGYGYNVTSVGGDTLFAQGSGLTDGGGTVTFSATLGSGPPGPAVVSLLLVSAAEEEVVATPTIRCDGEFIYLDAESGVPINGTERAASGCPASGACFKIE